MYLVPFFRQQVFLTTGRGLWPFIQWLGSFPSLQSGLPLSVTVIWNPNCVYWNYRWSLLLKGYWPQCRWSERTCMHSSMQISFNSFKHWQGGPKFCKFCGNPLWMVPDWNQINLPNVYLQIQSHSEMCLNCTLLGPRLYCQSDFYID